MSMIPLKARFVASVVALVVVAVTGCGPRAQPADPTVAATTLRQAFDAWKDGEAADAFVQRSAVTVVDPKWQQGVRLVSYEVIGDGDMNGFDWQYKVRLTLQGGGGKQSHEKAVYRVSTSPTVVIVRAEES
jgi:hypothetical protein